MRTRGATLWGEHQDWKVEEIDIEPPRAGEVLVEWKAAGLCHSDEHMVTGDLGATPELLQQLGVDSPFPLLGGHEGAGVVLEVGSGVTRLKPGDRVAASFVPACGFCRYCAVGQQALCETGVGAMAGGMITDGSHRHFIAGEPVNLLAKLGTFANHTCVAETSLVRVADDLPFECVALVSCGVATGWGSATVRANVRPGDTVVVVGVGGVGINAVQGASVAGARRVVAVDPVEFKRTTALQLGATHAYASMEEAIPAVRELTHGHMAEKVILAPGVVYGDLTGPGLSLAGKGGTVVVTGVAPRTQTDVKLNLFELAMWNKELKGTIYGSLNPQADIPRLLELYRDGTLKLDELITQRYPLDGINDGYRAMRDGENIRGVVVYD